jgi:hypothetical protein
MPRFHGSFFATFLIVSDNRSQWGPFDTPDEAAKWAIDNLASGGHWSIRPVTDPSSESQDDGPTLKVV